jgi:hypothetical protein
VQLARILVWDPVRIFFFITTSVLGMYPRVGSCAYFDFFFILPVHLARILVWDPVHREFSRYRWFS